MILYTAQISQYRGLREANIPYIDTTIKSGDKHLAPTWEMVSRHKAGTLTDQGYVDLYIPMMRASYRRYDAHWRKIALMDKVALMCYCPHGIHSPDTHPNFCHRFVLVELFERICKHNGIPFTYAGEWVRGEVLMSKSPHWLTK